MKVFLTGLVNTTEQVGNAIRAFIKQIGGLNNGRQSCKISSSYGRYANPNANVQSVMINTSQYNSDPYVIGFLQEWDANWQWSLANGELVDCCNEFALKYDNVNGLRAYILSKPTFLCTLSNGEFNGQMMLNRINEIILVINALNENLSALQTAFNGHTHQYNPGGGSPTPSGSPSTTFTPSPVSQPTTLSTDTTYIQDNNYLIGADAKNYGE